jgi:hypothetical protein
VLSAKPADTLLANAGRWLRAPGLNNKLSLPFTFATADAAVLLALPAGCYIRPIDFYWTASVPFTGGASSAIGAGSNLATYTAKGALLGGAGGDVAATLIASAAALGTAGSALGTVAGQRLLLGPTNTVRFDRITSAFTAGAGTIELVCDLLKNAGA